MLTESALSLAIIENAVDAIIAKSLDGTVTAWNAGAAQLFGYSAEEMIGAPITRLFPSDRLHEEGELIARLIMGKVVSHFVTRRIRKDGAHIDVSITLSPDDAIIAKTCDGTVITWNSGATRIFGYTAAEMIGTSITRLFPAGRLHEEAELIAQLTQGTKISHFVTQRLRKNGSSIEVSVAQVKGDSYAFHSHPRHPHALGSNDTHRRRQ